MRIYIVRHGETLFNTKHRIQGWCDSALTSTGIQQAKALHEGLKDVSFTAAYTSTSERAIDTATYVLNDQTIPLHQVKALKEINFGTLEGEYEEDYLAKDGSTHDLGFVAYGGETLAMTTQRMVECLHNIAKTYQQDENILVVSHGGAIMCALLGLFHMDIQTFRNQGKHIENCSVTILEYHDTFTLHSLSDTSYRERKGDQNDI